MRFLLDAEQRGFAASLDALLSAADVPAVIRSRAAGDDAPLRALWRRLADVGVFALAVPETYGGTGLLPVELVLSCVELGRHGMPGPLAETFAASTLLESVGQTALLPGVASGQVILSLAAEGGYAADPDLADAVLRVGEGKAPLRQSLDPARRVGLPEDAIAVESGAERATGLAALCTAALALGTGRHLLAATVEYARTRTQFGTPIGGFQAVKHRLADVLLQLDFAEPLLYGAAVALQDALPSAGSDIAAAKAACGEAGYAAARAALQLHGAIGYTDEFDLSLWIRRARVLRNAWGTPSACRRRVLAGRIDG
ncbi:acyl-CoA dehydrogenase family protein [Streptacidiphilus carbonis]|jgi:alkylation response protein AidB-like acyl-CoA dehydrogenase|uniref:acyl-CoA dehydrogenase family protein n=1 Tax=Streptacidiphilus carbonis TaxID=105422 RepID=UPI0005AACBA6|nr:acyl-CoA dehydrogenase family protein [Streptacidiphilus carbonis]